MRIVIVNIFSDDDPGAKAKLVIQDLGTRPMDSEIKDFEVTLSVNRGSDIFGRYKRVLDGFPANSLNVVALVKAALNLFSSDSLVAEDDDSNTDPDSSDMERGFSRTLQDLPTQEESRLRNNGPAIRGGQPEQHGGDCVRED